MRCRPRHFPYYGSALRTAEGLCTSGKLSQKGTSACAFVYSSLNYAVSAKKASLDMDEGALAARALQFYEKAVDLDPDDMAAWYGVLTLVRNTHDVAYAATLGPKVDLVQSKHRRIGSFAGAVATMYSMTGDYEKAINHGITWQNNALTSSERAQAAVFVSRLKDSAERKHAADAAAASK